MKQFQKIIALCAARNVAHENYKSLLEKNRRFWIFSNP